MNKQKAAVGNSPAASDPWVVALGRVASHRDRQQFKKIFDHFAPQVKGFLLKGMSAHIDKSQAEEITQEVMIKVWNKAASFNSAKASVSTWIFTIARNTRVDFIRRNERAERKIEVDDIWHEADSPEPLIELQQRRAESSIKNALKTLPEEQALVLEKAFLEGKSHFEISEELSLPLGTVKSRIRLALNKLKILLDR
ncbi:MAG: sigma-70 family RNA polymerase sigma factor [Pseudohongiellaceae bacterium]|nr:sigma-70 family RNA polymerase sigma factor [Pseudohongiellaceae bacterium]